MSTWALATGLSTYLQSVRWHRVAYGAGKFVAMGSDPSTGALVIAYSTDGINWTQATTPSGSPYNVSSIADLIFANGIFVGIGTSVFAAWDPLNTTIPEVTSTDGVAWTLSTPNISGATGAGVNPQPVFIDYENSQFLIQYIDGTTGLTFAASSDGLTWATAGSLGSIGATNPPWGAFVYNAGTYVVKARGDAYTGSSLTSLTHHTVSGPVTEQRDAAVFGASIFGTIDWFENNPPNQIYSSPDGATWTGSTGPTGTNLTNPTMLNLQFVNNEFWLFLNDDIGNDRFFTSPDFSTWTEQIAPSPPGASGSAQYVAYDGSSKLVTVDSVVVGAIMYSSTGPPMVTVPNVVGDTQTTATLAITAAGLLLGPVSETHSTTVPIGQVVFQVPVAGTSVVSGSQVAITLSLGSPEIAVPDVVGLTASNAESVLAGAQLTTGAITGVTNPNIAIGSVGSQDPVAGTLVIAGTPVDLGISFIVPEFDVDVTVISQYANSPTILAMVENFAEYFDPAANLQNFYLDVWNIDTAIGFGLDIWGIILGVSRVVPIPGTSGAFGFDNSDTPPDWENFGNPSELTAGGPFFSGQVTGNSYKLNDGPYRTLLLTKAFANICTTTAPALNALITNLFPGRGKCYTADLGGMQMSYIFDFTLSTIENAILAYSGVLAHPAGVGVNITVFASPTFGFAEALPGSEPWNFGAFFGA